MSPFVVGLLAMLWLPGHLILRLSNGALRSRIRWTEKLFAEVSISLALLLWIAVSLGTLGVLSGAALLGGAAAAVLLATVALWKRDGRLPRPAGFSPDRSIIVVVVLVIAGSLLYQPTFEQVVGGRDPVTYLVSGMHLGRTGSWIAHDEIVTTIPEEHRTFFLGPDLRETRGHWSSRFLGWYLMEMDTGRVVPQGLPLYPATIAIGYLAGDTSGALRTTSVLAIATVLAVFFLGTRLLSAASGFAAALLLLVSPAQVWFSRFANAESVAQLLLVVGLYGLLMQRRSGGWAYGLMASLAFGLSWQAHIWTVWLVLPLFSILVFDLLRGRVDRTAMLSFWGPLSVLGVQALAVYFTVTTAYMEGAFRVIRWSMWALIPLAPAGLILLSALWYWGRRRRGGGQPDKDGVAAGVGWPRVLAAAAVVVGAAYGYWVRPAISVVENAWRAESFERLVLAVTFSVFGFAVAGAALLLLDRRRGEATTCLLAVALGMMVPVLWEPNIVRPLMWSLRRYQTFLPLVFLFAAVPLWVVEERSRGAGRTAPLGRWANAIVAVFLFVPLAMQGWTYRGFKQPGESVALVEDIAASVEDNAVLIFEHRSGWGALDFAAPLAYWKGFDVVRMWHKRTNQEALRDFVRRQAQRGRPVYFFTQGFNYFVSEPRMEPHRRWWFPRQNLEETRGRLPELVRSSRFPISSYRVLPAGANGPLDGMLDVGHWDDIYVGEALPWEVTGELSARWTKATAFFWLPGLEQGAREIVVHADTIHGSEAFNRSLRARLDGVELGEIHVEQQWTDYVFEVPSDWRPTAGVVPMLELTIEPLQPDAVNGNGDTRYLGVFVDAILWR